MGKFRPQIDPCLRQRLAAWDFLLGLCGDYLDGPSSEGALRNGEEAAERVTVNLMLFACLDGSGRSR